MLIPVFFWDKDKYFAFESVAQRTNDGHLAMPNDATLEKPELRPTHFAKWDGHKWIYEAKPTKVEDFVGVKVSHVSQTPHDIELRAILQALVEQAEGWRIVRGDESEGLWWSVEKIPEKTEAEIKKERISELKGKLSSTDYVATKIAEGAATREEYAQVLADRQSWRDEINQLQVEIEALNK